MKCRIQTSQILLFPPPDVSHEEQDLADMFIYVMPLTLDSKRPL